MRNLCLPAGRGRSKGGGRTVWPDKVVLSRFEPLVFSRFVGLHRFTTVVACSAVSAAAPAVVVSLLVAACVVVAVVVAPSACACKIIINVLLMSCDY